TTEIQAQPTEFVVIVGAPGLPSVHDSYKPMATEPLTQTAGTALGTHGGGPRAFLVVHIEDADRSSRVVDLPDATDVTFGRSRDGTRVNGEKVEGVHRLESGDEISIGPILAVVGVTTGLRKSSPVADDAAGEARLAAEVDRSVRYHRPLTVGLIRCANDAVVDAIARSLRPMDLIAEDAGDDYLVIL